MPQEVTRKVYFYRTHTDVEEDGSLTSYNPGPALAHIDRLGFSEDGRYMRRGGTDFVCCWIDKSRSPQRIRLGKIRRADLPSVEEGGKLSPLQIPDDAGVVEQTHHVFFRSDIVGMLYNFYGPRMASLRTYLRKKHPDTPDSLQIDPLLRQDVLEQLSNFAEVRVLDLKVIKPFIARIKEADKSLADAFSAAAEAGSADQVNLVLQPEPYKREWLGKRLLNSALRLAELVAGDPDAREEVTRFRLKGLNAETQTLDEVDVLHDHLVREKEVVRLGDRTRSIHPDSAYAAIHEAHEELEDQLHRAAMVEPL